MVYSYEFTDLAIKDINDAINYIEEKLANKKAAKDLFSLLEKTIEDICAFPKAYPNCKYYFIKDDSIRHVLIKNYVLVFKINETKIVFFKI